MLSLQAHDLLDLDMFFTFLWPGDFGEKELVWTEMSKMNSGNVLPKHGQHACLIGELRDV